LTVNFNLATLPVVNQIDEIVINLKPKIVTEMRISGSSSAAPSGRIPESLTSEQQEQAHDHQLGLTESLMTEV
jgi:hypothetical protein